MGIPLGRPQQWQASEAIVCVIQDGLGQGSRHGSLEEAKAAAVFGNSKRQRSKQILSDPRR